MIVDPAILDELEETFGHVIRNKGTIRDAIAAALAAYEHGHREMMTTDRLVLRAACRHFQCSIKELLTKELTDHYSRRRYATMVALRRAGLRLKEIAAALGYRDHCVVDYGLKKAKRREDIQRDGEAIWALTNGRMLRYRSTMKHWPKPPVDADGDVISPDGP